MDMIVGGLIYGLALMTIGHGAMIFFMNLKDDALYGDAYKKVTFVTTFAAILVILTPIIAVSPEDQLVIKENLAGPQMLVSGGIAKFTNYIVAGFLGLVTAVSLGLVWHNVALKAALNKKEVEMKKLEKVAEANEEFVGGLMSKALSKVMADLSK